MKHDMSAADARAAMCPFQKPVTSWQEVPAPAERGPDPLLRAALQTSTPLQASVMPTVPLAPLSVFVSDLISS
jgi:hypothetical protein